MSIRFWEKMPTQWIRDGGLKDFKLTEKADNIGALLAYLVLVHRNEMGYTKITYDAMCGILNISREKLSQGLKILEKKKLVFRDSSLKTIRYKIADYGDPPWGKLPVSRLYDEQGSLYPFKDFHLRSKNELNALKLYFYIVAARNVKMNCAKVSYLKIAEQTGIARNDIRPAISMLINIALIHVDSEATNLSEHGMVNLYRLRGIDNTHHRGTSGRIDPFGDAAESSPF